MSGNNGQGQKSGRWYKLCFVPSSADSSDDSDTESVVIVPTTPIQTSTSEEPSPESPPHPPLPREPQINWLDPPPPPPPPPLFSIPSSQSSWEHRINWRDPPPPPPPPTLQPLQAWAAAFEIESQQQPGIYQPPNPRHAASLDHDSPQQFFTPPHSPQQFFSPPPSQEHQINWHNPPPPLQPLQAWAAAVEADQSECLLQVPAIRRVRITELDQRDKLSHCPICMEEFKMGDEAYQLPCNHAYRSECIFRWLNNRKTCPVCRLQLDGWKGQISSSSDNTIGYHTDTAWDYFFPGS